MADKQKEQLMYSDKEINLLKATFAENESLLKTIRRLFLGGELTDIEKNVIKETFQNQELIEAFRHKVYGLDNYDTPIGQVSDFWLGAEKQIFGASRDTIEQVVQSKAMVRKMFETAFNLLRNPDGEKVDTLFIPSEIDGLQIKLLARNLYIQAIETSLLTVLTIAGKKDETLEQTLARLQRDSSK